MRRIVLAFLLGALFSTSELAIVAARSQATPVHHVVVIDLENHSFDNVLGYWCDANPERCPDGGMPTSVTLSDGSVVTPTVTPDTVPSVNHSVGAQITAMNIQGGIPQMNGWQNIVAGWGALGCDASTNYQCISGYLPSQVPNIATLASRFAISDRTFSMADSPSWGGHLYPVMGSLDRFTGDNPVSAPGVAPGPGWGCDSKRVTRWMTASGALKLIPSCIPDYQLGLAHGGAFERTPAAYHATILDELKKARLSWRIYGAARPSDSGYAWSVCPSLAECHDTSQTDALVDASRFMTAAGEGKLPAFSLVVGGGANKQTAASSCHNRLSMTACDNYIGRLVSAAENGSEWSSTAIFITFDDFGGFYDQVAPSVNPDTTQQGPRLPLIIVSPYVRAGYTDTGSTTFAGILGYVEHNFGLPALGVNDSRAYRFGRAFNYSQPPLKPVHLSQRSLPASARDISASAVGKDTS